MVGGTTRVFGIVGDPVDHSLSPPMQNAAFRAIGFDAIYVPFHVPVGALATALPGLWAAGVAGLNVTVPHKEEALHLARSVRPRARACGAVNTLIRGPRGFIGDNTDGLGFVAALRDARVTPAGMHVLVIGAGGSARSVVHALLEGRVAEIVVANRTVARARDLAKAFRRRRVVAAGLESLRDATLLARTDLIVNCTSAGLQGTSVRIAWPATRRDVVGCDLLYGRRPSPFLRQARAARRRTMDGSGMLLHQGALAFERWTGTPAPVAAMRRALRAALRR